MKAEIFYNNVKLKNIEGKTIQGLIEDNFDLLKDIISEKTGNAAGFSLERVWVSRKDDKFCELHIIAHGSDLLIGYDPNKDEEKEIIFQITGLSKNELKEKYEVELEEKKFNPFDEKWYINKSAVVGILEGCVDYLAQIFGRKEEPSMIVQRCHINLKENNLSLYISQLMMQFGLASIKKTKENRDIFELIEKTNNILVDLMKKDNKRITTEEIIIYYKTVGYFHKRDKITALKFYREKLNKTQKEIAEAAGISLRQYQRYETINSTLGIANAFIVEKISNVLGVNVEDLVCCGTVMLKE